MHVAKKLITKMEASNKVSPDSYTYNQLLKGFCKANKLKEAYSLLMDKMEVKGLCNSVSYNTIIQALCESRKLGSAYRMFKDMGMEAGKDQYVFAILINGFFREGHPDLAEDLFHRMIASGLTPDVVVYTIMVDHNCRSGKIEGGLEYFNDMIEKGIRPDAALCNALVTGLCRSRQVGDAMKL